MNICLLAESPNQSEDFSDEADKKVSNLLKFIGLKNSKFEIVNL